MIQASDHNSNSGIVLEIQRMSTEDGPGIRTTVFLKGCSLRCAWCHNPESIRATPQVQWIDSRCIACRLCNEVCPRDGLELEEGQGMQIDRERCTGCGSCAEECPANAMELLGTRWSARELVRELVKDRAYFEKSGGGVTVSGGEATMQSEFVAALFEGLREERVHTALDTCGQCSRAALDLLLPRADMILYDLKLIDPEAHKKYTDRSNERILENLSYVGEYLRNRVPRMALWVRTPIIPGATDSEENIRGVGAFLDRHLGGVLTRWELCAFNNLCADKYKRLGLDWPFEGCSLMSREEMENLALVARKSGVDPEVVSWSGSTRMETASTEGESGGGNLSLVGC